MASCTRDLQKVSALLCLKKLDSAGGVGGIVGCHVTIRQGKPVDLAISVRVVAVVTKR
jgi:DNA-binding transcriptional regulator LsrR (DeoR family)